MKVRREDMTVVAEKRGRGREIKREEKGKGREGKGREGDLKMLSFWPQAKE